MNQLNPQIRNYLRGQLHVGPSDITPTHHLPRRHEEAEPVVEDETVETERSAEQAQKRTSRVSQLFRSAIIGIQLRTRGQEYGSAET